MADKYGRLAQRCDLFTEIFHKIFDAGPGKLWRRIVAAIVKTQCRRVNLVALVLEWLAEIVEHPATAKGAMNHNDGRMRWFHSAGGTKPARSRNAAMTVA